MRNNYIILIIQALLTLLLFFAEGYTRYATIALLSILNLTLLITLMHTGWDAEETLTLGAIFTSVMFTILYASNSSAMILTLGIGVMLLFIIIAMINFTSGDDAVSKAQETPDAAMPEAPSYYHDYEYEPKIPAREQPSAAPIAKTTREPSIKSDKPANHEVHKEKTAARAVAYELEREAMQIKNAEKLLKDLEVYHAEDKLLKESRALEDAQKQIDAVKKRQETTELKKEAAELLKVQRQISDIKKLQKAQEVSKEAKILTDAEKSLKRTNTANIGQDLKKQAQSLKNAERQIQQIKFLDQQEKIVKQAKAIAKSQKGIDAMNKKNTQAIKATKTASKKPASKSKIKIVKTKDESFYFATENGNKFHEPGCLSIKKVPKNKLTLFTNKKDAMKKGLQPCSVCIPK